MAKEPTMRQVTTPDVPEPPPGTFSHCFVVGNTIHISGQHAATPADNSVLQQTRETLKRVLSLINAAGGTADDVVKINVYLCDMSRRAEVSAARREVFEDPMPCSTLVGIAALGSPDLLIEIDAIAVIGAGGRRAAARG
jgi:enamine deaminase RidA (YjgF/YER057c/UK114 family)